MINKEQWQQIAAELQGGYPTVKLRLGGDEINISRVRVTESKSALFVFINGSYKFNWGDPAHKDFNRITERLWRKWIIRRYSPAQKKKIKKDFGVRGTKKYFPDFEKEDIQYMPDFGVARTLCGKLKKIKELEIVQVGYQPKNDNRRGSRQ